MYNNTKKVSANHQVASELDKALPALQAAEEALNVLTKKDMSELKAYSKPPALVELTLGGVMTVLKRYNSNNKIMYITKVYII